MKVIDVSDAQRIFSQLLDEVERGETFVITRDGRRIARIVPETHRSVGETHRNAENISRAIEAISAMSKSRGRLIERLSNQPPQILEKRWNRDDLYED